MENLDWDTDMMSSNSSDIILSLRNTIANFKLELNKLNYNFNNYFKFIFSNEARPRRGIGAVIGVVGTVIDLLFSATTKIKINTILKKINNLMEVSEQQRKALNLRSQLLNVTIRDAAELKAAMSRIEISQSIL